MDVSILEVKVYMYPKCPFYFKKTFNHLIYIYFHTATCSSLRKKVTNKTYVEISICNAYIVEEILIFILCYFEPYMKTKINHVLRYNDDGGVISSENLSIFPYLG